MYSFLKPVCFLRITDILIICGWVILTCKQFKESNKYIELMTYMKDLICRPLEWWHDSLHNENQVNFADIVCIYTKSLQSCPTLCNPMDCSPPGFSVHGIFPARNTEVGGHFLFQRIFPTQGLNLSLLCLLHWQAGSLPLTWYKIIH